MTVSKPFASGDYAPTRALAQSSFLYALSDKLRTFYASPTSGDRVSRKWNLMKKPMTKLSVQTIQVAKTKEWRPDDYRLRIEVIQSTKSENVLPLS